MKWLNRSLAFGLCCLLLVAAGGHSERASAQQSPEELQQLVAPIALYPDPLVAQILAASTYPSEVVDAGDWIKWNSGLEGQSLADAVDPQPWDPSVKALVEFPTVLDSMNRNLAWTSALGDAYVNQPQDVLDAVQALRQRAQSAGTLQSSSEETVTTQDSTIAIEPADPDVVYVPEYDPWAAYGEPLAAYPDWVGVPGIYYDGSDPYFGAGIAIAGLAWAWSDWGFDWRHKRVTHRHDPYVSHSRTFVNRHDYDRGSGRADQGAHLGPGPVRIGRGAAPFGPGPVQIGRGAAPVDHAAPFQRPPTFAGGLGSPGRTGVHSGAFSGFDHGGVTRGYASRGQSSFGGGFSAGGLGAAGGHASGFGGEGMHAGGALGGGGFHGGGGGGGGGHR